jgi:predicted CXXCH cytochrome family protein
MLILLPLSGQPGVLDSMHNLSASGRGSVKAAAADRICIFCHVSHSANTESPLWSRKKPTAAYVPYSSSTAIARPGQPTGDSVLCLSCHDGTIALGQIINRGKPISMAGGVGRMPPGKGLQGTDLSDDHPISFEYSVGLALQNGELAIPGTFDNALRLDRNGELQCTTCHDAHDSPYDYLLRVPNIRSLICVECHTETGWSESSHSLSDATWNGRNPDPWSASPYSSVSDNGCQNCHAPHNEAGGPRLLLHMEEEENCANCHNGNVATKDVMQSFDNVSAHGIEDTTLAHDPTEPAVVNIRHVECVDCHDPHAAKANPMTGDAPSNVRGVNLAGAEVAQATRTYEICLRCHGDSPNQPPARTPRQFDQSNIRLKIQLNSPSYHPIASVGRNPDVPSLITPLTEQSIISCVDCHNSSSAVSVGGDGPEGPHGSAYQPILSRSYVTMDNTLESASNYSLCYSCHSRDSILSNESFPTHELHVNDENTPCNACHDPHGISATQGNTTNNSHLINFDTSIVSLNGNGLRRFVDKGDRAGSCDLLCHSEDHNGFEY